VDLKYFGLDINWVWKLCNYDGFVKSRSLWRDPWSYKTLIWWM